MSANIQLKFRNYWDDCAINYLLFVVVVLDPRYKYDYVEFGCNNMYGGAKRKYMLKTLKDLG